jgi:hypothetical protein
MRVMVLVKATEDSEKGFQATPETKAAMEPMGRFNDELRKAGILRMADGLKPSSTGKRVAFDGVGRTVIDGPARRPAARAGRRLLAVGGQGHGRGGHRGEALPQSHAGTERDRDPTIVPDG